MGEAIQTDVLVIGAGLVELAAAIELGLCGTRVLLVERNARVGAAPRAKTIKVRTWTHMRRWGIADRLAERAPFGIDYPNSMVSVTRLAGHEIARFANAFNTSPKRSPLHPEHAQRVPQYTLNRMILEEVRALPSVDVRFDTSFMTAVQDDEQVLSTLRFEGGEAYDVAARYLIGADGARSATSALIGAKMKGRYGLFYFYNIILRAPGLAKAHEHGPAVIYWQMGKNGADPTLVRPDQQTAWRAGMGTGALVHANGQGMPYIG